MANSGWTNDAVDSLTVPTGATSGERVIIANQANGDAIDIYDVANQLVFSIDKNGRLVSYSTVNTAEVVIVGASVFFEDSAQSPQLPPQIQGLLAPDQVDLVLSSGTPRNAAGLTSATLQLISGDTSSSPTIQASQRGVTGVVMQADANQLVHTGTYSGTVADAFGDVLIAHNAGFTPQSGQITHWDVNSTGQGYTVHWFGNPFTFSPGNMAFFARTQTGGIPAIGTEIGVHAVLFG